MEAKRERLGSRLGFILLSAGCAIGCGNVWKFPWMTGQYGGGAFVLVYLLCLVVLGLPCMVMEFALGRASQKSPVLMYQQLEKPGHKWHYHGYVALFGNFCLMAFYTVVTGWMIYYFYRFVGGIFGANLTDLEAVTDVNNPFVNMLTNPTINVVCLLITVVVGFGVLCFKIQSGLEKVTKVMMIGLLVLMLVLAVRSMTLNNAGEGLKFYLLPDFTKIDGTVVVGAMNQAFFTLSIGIGSMAIFGSYIGKEKSLMGESINVIALDTFVALVAGLIIFPACSSYGIDVGAGPALLFNTMSTVFVNMAGGAIWGSIFFLFMMFAAFSTVFAVFENILACVRELSGMVKEKIAAKKGLTLDENKKVWSRPFGCIICGIVVFCMALTTALMGSAFSGFVPFAEGSGWLDFWDFIVSTNLLPIGSLVICLFCSYKFGWGWDNFVNEANAGEGLKVQNWMKPIFKYVVPAIVIFVYIYGLITFAW